jgi:hypothetical protein
MVMNSVDKLRALVEGKDPTSNLELKAALAHVCFELEVSEEEYYKILI